MRDETLTGIGVRIRGLYAARTVCGLLAIGCVLRLDRIIRLRASGRFGEEEALRLALETEAVALMFRPLPSLGPCRLISL